MTWADDLLLAYFVKSKQTVDVSVKICYTIVIKAGGGLKMYKMCKTEQSARRQRELEEGLLRAMSNCHYEQISVSDLCDRCAIPRKAFYRYFTGKDGALYALMNMMHSDYGDAIQAVAQGDDYALTCYRMALSWMKDRDHPNDVREYFCE